MRYKFFTHYFLVTLLAVSIAAGLVWLDFFRDYRATLSILVIEKTPGMEAPENLSELSKNLRFYDMVLTSNDLLDDIFAGRTPDERKAGWQKIVTVTHTPSSGLLTLIAWGDTQERARLLAVTSAATLFETASQYYNVKSELDMRIVDGPLVAPAISSYPLYVGVSVFSGLLVTLSFFVLLSLFDRWLGRGKNPDTMSTHTPPFVGEDMFKPSVPTQWQDQKWGRDTISEVESEVSERKEFEIGEPQPTPHARGTAAAPANLPVLESDTLATSPLQGAMARLMKEDIDETARLNATEPGGLVKEPPTPRTEEPTQEEYRRRLNALLSGKME